MLASVEELLSRKTKLNDIGSENKGFAGDLKDLSIVELVQMLNLNRKSGSLNITAGNKGKIYLKDGQLHAAECGDIVGEDAIYKLVEQVNGKFNFEIDDVAIDRNINSSTMNVIMEACRIMDEKRLNE